jgi:uncharacterized OB-fold protein
MAEKDLRKEPGQWRDEEGVFILPDEWRLSYMVSCGELSPFFRALKEEGKLMGARCPSCGSIYCPPRSWCHDCYEDTEWVEMSGKGELIAFTKGYFATSDLVDEVPFYQGGVRLEGARYPIVCRIKLDDEEKLRPGIPMRVEFKTPEERLGRVTDYYFVLDE